MIPLQTKHAKYQVSEYRVDLSATYDNPFDSQQVALDATLIGPSGARKLIPGFLYRSFKTAMVSGKEVTVPAGRPEWRLRVTPTEIGSHSMVVSLRDASGVATSRTVKFVAASNTNAGFIHLSPQDRRYFAHSNGAPYYPLGDNVCWGGDEGVSAYDKWLPKYGAQGANYARLWLGPQWATFALETAGPGHGFGQFDLGNAWRLDHVLNLAQRQGIYLMLCFDSYNTLRDKDAYPQWEMTPLNRANGGPLANPVDYWSSSAIRKGYRDRMRYLVARYGANPNVFAWEFWNEVDLTRGYDPAVVTTWHRDRARELKAMDPYHHLVSTSFSNSIGTASIDALPEIDFLQTHLYSTNLVREGAALHRVKGATKAHFIGEIGADAGGPRREDTKGVQVHDALWTGIANGMSGTAMTWWWDNLVEPNGLYPLFGAAHRFAKGINWPREGFRAATVDAEYADPKAVSGPGDLEIGDGPVGFGPADFNRPQTLQIRGGRVVSGGPVSALMHGTRNHADLHNPLTFDVVLEKPTKFQVEVSEVSGYGGAHLQIFVDGKSTLDRDFADPDDNAKTDALAQYRGVYDVTVPAGRHQIRVDNVGNDWIRAAYRLRGVLKQAIPPLDFYAIRGKQTAIVWATLKGRSWKNVVELGRSPAACPATRVVVRGLAEGTWRVERWDTWRGVIVSQATTHSDGKSTMPIAIPSVESDLALKLRRVQ